MKMHNKDSVSLVDLHEYHAHL